MSTTRWNKSKKVVRRLTHANMSAVTTLVNQETVTISATPLNDPRKFSPQELLIDKHSGGTFYFRGSQCVAAHF